MSALSGKRVACVTKDVLQKMRNDTSFRSSYDVVLLKSKSYPSMSGPMLPRRTGEPTYPVTAQDYYRRIFFKAIDLMMNAIDQRFEQPSFDTYAKMESLSIKTLNSQDKSDELKFVERVYNDDVNISVLTAQMKILQVLLKDGDYFCFDDIIVKIKELPNPEREMIKDVITLWKLILVNPATSAAGERSFSTARRLKIWLRSRMNQERFSNLTVLNIHKERTDKLSAIDVANEVTYHNTNRKRNFGTFRVNDVQLL